MSTVKVMGAGPVGWIRLPPNAAPPSQRAPPASIALDRGSGIPAASYRQNEGSTGPLVWVTGSAVAHRMVRGRSIVRVTA
jgi:hypothetical protein